MVCGFAASRAVTTGKPEAFRSEGGKAA